MWSARLAATAKHFPGLGRAEVNTDDGTATEHARARSLPRGDRRRRAARDALARPLSRRSTRPGSPRSRPAIATGLLRERLGFDGVAITDSIEAQAVLDRSDVAVAAERSVRAGADLILMTGSASWNEVYPAAAEAGAPLAGVPRARARARRRACWS